VEDCQEEYGDFFTIRIPFQFDLTYILTPEGFRFVMDLDAEEGRMGAVMERVPTVGFWYRRSVDTEPHLQALMLAGREFMRDHILTRRAVDAMVPRIRETVASHAESWQGEVDLGQDLVHLIHDAAGRCAVGDALWDAIGDEAIPLYRHIVEGINIPRTTLAVTPVFRMMPEYRSTIKLQRLLDRVIATHRRTGRYPFIDAITAIEIDGRPLADADVSWMLMYILWNALNYPGSYGFWAFAQALSDPGTHQALMHTTGHARRQVLWNGLRETLRLYPVASLVRANPQPVEYVHEGTRYIIPAGGYIGTFPYHLARSADRYGDPVRYDPTRYDRGAPSPSIYGRGAFGCVAQRFIKVLLVTTMEALLDRSTFRLSGPLPRRLCRVHLLYPEAPVMAEVRARPQPLPALDVLPGDDEVDSEQGACPEAGAVPRGRCPVTGHGSH
jgi:cytochrome P450